MNERWEKMGSTRFQKSVVLFRLVQCCFLLGAFLIVMGSGFLNQKVDLPLISLGIFLVVASLMALLNPKKLRWPKVRFF